MKIVVEQQALAHSPTLLEEGEICRIYFSPNTNDIYTQINQQIPEHTQHALLPRKLFRIGADFFFFFFFFIAGSRGREIPIGFPGPLVHKTG